MVNYYWPKRLIPRNVIEQILCFLWLRRWHAWQLIMMGLAAKSSTEGSFFTESGLTLTFTELLLELASTFSLLAKTRLTSKQLRLLFSAFQALRFHPHLSPTGLADYLARKCRMPLSTTKFNLRVLRNAGLLETKLTETQRTIVRLSLGGHLLTQLLPCPNMDLDKSNSKM